MWSHFGVFMQVSIRELKANPSHAIALMLRGERVEITSHRKVVAELVRPVKGNGEIEKLSDDQAMANLVSAGLVAQEAVLPLKLGKPLRFETGSDPQSMSDLVIAARGPR
jgi:antitoxin (DNA-binding transcriptional repressor) of toxin-antitoxin stability system